MSETFNPVIVFKKKDSPLIKAPRLTFLKERVSMDFRGMAISVITSKVLCWNLNLLKCVDEQCKIKDLEFLEKLY